MTLPSFPAELLPAAIVIVIAALLAGLARGFSGFGAALIFVPIGSAVLGPVVALPVLLLADMATSSRLIKTAWGNCAWSDVRGVAVGGLAGLPIGNYVLTAVDPIAVRWVIVALILASLTAMLTGWKPAHRPSPATDAGIGLISGLMSGIAQIGGPPVVIYWLATQSDPGRTRANLSVYFALMMWTSLGIFAIKGLVTAKVLWLAAVAAPGYALGIAVGARLFGLASPLTFRRISIALVAIATVLGLPTLDPYLKWGQ